MNEIKVTFSYAITKKSSNSASVKFLFADQKTSGSNAFG